MYIRTKDGIIAFGEKYAYPTRLSNGKTYFSFKELTEDRFEVMKEYNHWEILNQSENLEELCDEFVLNHKNIKLPYLCDRMQKRELLKDRAKLFNFGFKKVYGAIWTDKGLIYVAKMNDKGELVLI